MSKTYKNSKVFLKAIGIILFTILSYVKFYTTQVSFSSDPTVAIVTTSNIQLLSNNYKISASDLPYNWYDNYGFKILKADETGHIWQSIHSFVIILWWISLVYLLIIAVYIGIKNRNKNAVD